jgi:hypothetical protein
MVVWAAGLVACGSATGLPMPQPGDAGTDVAASDAFVEPELPECEGEHLVHRYVLDGETNVSACVPAASWTNRWAGTGTTQRPDYQIGFGNPFHRDDPRNPFSGLREPACGVGITIDNLWPPATGTRGNVEAQTFGYRDEIERTSLKGWMGLTYSADEGSCRVGDIASSEPIGGRWEVIQGASTPGEWLTVEARDVSFEYLGRTILFEHMRWHVRLGEPSWPGP